MTTVEHEWRITEEDANGEKWGLLVKVPVQVEPHPAREDASTGTVLVTYRLYSQLLSAIGYVPVDSTVEAEEARYVE